MSQAPALSNSFARRRTRHIRKGFALAAALLAIVLIGALVAGVLFATTEDTRTSAVGVAREIALIAGESAVVMTITDPGITLPASIGVVGTISHQVYGPGSPVSVYITRLDSAMYWIVAEAVAEPVTSGAKRRVGVVVKTARGGDNSITIDPISQRPWSELF